MSIVLDFAIGRRVVCVSNKDWDRTVMSSCPEVGKVYTVRWTSDHLIDGYLGIKLSEIVSRPIGRMRPLGDNNEWVFQSVYFKPLDESRLDVFRALLVKSSIWGGNAI